METIKTWTDGAVTYRLQIGPEDVPVRGNAMASGAYLLGRLIGFSEPSCDALLNRPTLPSEEPMLFSEAWPYIEEHDFAEAFAVAADAREENTPEEPREEVTP